MFYVYLHKRESDKSVFYVGKGTGSRAWRLSGRSEYWNRVKKKHGLIVEIYRDSLSEKEAHELEMILIKEIGRHRLCNHTNGGEGMYGWKMSEETRRKVSQQRKGRTHTDEAKKKMSERRKGVPKSPNHVENVSKSLKGRKFSNEHRENLSKALKKVVYDPEWGRKSGKARMKKVFCLNNSIEYESTKHASRELVLDSGSVSRVCRGIQKHTKGYIFRYVENENTRTK